MSSKEMNSQWIKRRKKIKSRAGKWIVGKDARFRNHSLLHDLLPKLTETQLMVYGISGRIIDESLSLWIEKAYFMTSYPDSRLWCNCITSLAANPNASPVASVVAGYLASDSKAYGAYAFYRAAKLIEKFFSENQKLNCIESLLEREFPCCNEVNLPGFMRPIPVEDERLAPMRKFTEELGLKNGERLKFSERLSEFIEKKYGGGLNAAGYYSAFMLDQGFTPEQIYLLCVRCTECGLLACYEEHVGEIENGFLPLACHDIHYSGSKIKQLK